MEAASEGWKSAVKDWRVSRAEVWAGEERRVGSMVDGSAGVVGRGGRGGSLERGGRRRESQVSRSVRRLVWKRLLVRVLGGGNTGTNRAICCSRSCILARFD